MDIRVQKKDDQPIIDGLVRLVFGDAPSMRAVWRLRPGPAIAPLSLVASAQWKIIGCVRFWEIMVGDKAQLLLGPLAINPALQGKGYGRAIVSDGLRRAEQLRRWSCCFVSGDPHYYTKFGFIEADRNRFIWPGELAPNRLLMRPLDQDGHGHGNGHGHGDGLASLPPGPVALLAQLDEDSFGDL